MSISTHHYFRGLRGLFLILTLSLASVGANAQSTTVYDFQGIIDFSTSSVFNDAESVDLSFTLSSIQPFSSSQQSGPGDYVYNLFQVPSVTFAVNGKTYVWEDTAVSAAVSSANSWNGFATGWNTLGDVDLQTVVLGFQTTDRSAVSSYGLPLGNVPLSDFSAAITLYDATYVPATSSGYASAAITGYSVEAIPEPSAYAAVLGAAALGLAVVRRWRLVA